MRQIVATGLAGVLAALAAPVQADLGPSAEQVLKKMKKETFDDGKISVLKTAIDMDAYTCEELVAFVGQFTFGSSKAKVVPIFADTNPCTETSSVIDPTACEAVVKLLDDSDRQHATEALAKAIPGTRANILSDKEIKELLAVQSKGAWNDADFKALSDGLGKLKMDDAAKLALVQDGLKSNPSQFTAGQVKSLVAAFDFLQNRVALSKAVAQFIVGLTCDDVVSILKTLKFSEEKLTFLAALKDNIVDAQNKVDIINSFTFLSEKESAANTLAGVCARKPPPNNPVFGRVEGDPVLFVMDKSGSMSTQFTIGGQSFTRDQFCHNELEQVLKGLPKASRFNIVLFSSAARLAFPDALPATAENIESALKIASGNVGGSTNSLGALQVAYGMPTAPQQIYFLSDGAPDQSAASIIAAVDGLDKGRKIPVNSIVFALPGFDRGAEDFMKALASKTGGFYRAVQNSQSMMMV